MWKFWNRLTALHLVSWLQITIISIETPLTASPNYAFLTTGIKTELNANAGLALSTDQVPDRRIVGATFN